MAPMRKGLRSAMVVLAALQYATANIDPRIKDGLPCPIDSLGVTIGSRWCADHPPPPGGDSRFEEKNSGVVLECTDQKQFVIQDNCGEKGQHCGREKVDDAGNALVRCVDGLPGKPADDVKNGNDYKCDPRVYDSTCDTNTDSVWDCTGQDGNGTWEWRRYCPTNQKCKEGPQPGTGRHAATCE